MVIAVLIGYLLLKDWAKETRLAEQAVISADLILGAACMAGALLYAQFQGISWRHLLNVIKKNNALAEKSQACATKTRSAIYAKGENDGRTATGTAAAPTK